MPVRFVLNQLDVPSFSVEDKNGSHFLVGHVKIAFGIDRHPIRFSQLPENLATFILRLSSSQPVHPGILLGFGSLYLRKLFCRIERLIADASDSWWVRP